MKAHKSLIFMFGVIVGLFMPIITYASHLVTNPFQTHGTYESYGNFYKDTVCKECESDRWDDCDGICRDCGSTKAKYVSIRWVETHTAVDYLPDFLWGWETHYEIRDLESE